MNSMLIILLGALGDISRGFSVLATLRKKYPQAKLFWLVEPKCEEIVRMHPLIDEVIVFERSKGFKGIVELREKLKAFHFDVTLDMQRHFKSGVFSLFSGAPIRVGFHRKNAKEGNWLFNNRYIAYKDESITPKINQYLDFAASLDADISEEADFGFPDNFFNAYIPNAISHNTLPLVCMVVGSSWASKDWPLEGYKVLSVELSNLGYALCYTGDKKKYDELQKFIDKEKLQNAYNLLGKTSLKELMAILKASYVCVGPDSGPAHLAAITKTPFISLFGPTSPERVYPYGNENLVITTSIGCRPCYRRECPGFDSLCMRSITPRQVLEKIDTLQSSQKNYLKTASH
jgi:lipopolysaccharide heptosyltransferase II